MRLFTRRANAFQDDQRKQYLRNKERNKRIARKNREGTFRGLFDRGRTLYESGKARVSQPLKNYFTNEPKTRRELHKEYMQLQPGIYTRTERKVKQLLGITPRRTYRKIAASPLEAVASEEKKERKQPATYRSSVQVMCEREELKRVEDGLNMFLVDNYKPSFITGVISEEGYAIASYWQHSSGVILERIMHVGTPGIKRINVELTGFDEGVKEREADLVEVIESCRLQK